MTTREAPANGELTYTDAADIRQDDAGTAAQRELAREAGKLAGDIDGKRWQLAQLAAGAKARNVQDWADIVGAKCKRKARTVRGWARAHAWMQDADAGHLIGLVDFSFFDKAARYAIQLDYAVIVDLLDTFASEQGASVEDFERELAALCEKPEPDLRKKWRTMADTLYGQIDSQSQEVAALLGTAADALKTASETRGSK